MKNYSSPSGMMTHRSYVVLTFERMAPHRRCAAEIADGEDDTAQHLLMQKLDAFHHSEEQFLPSYFRTANKQ
jgi:hypothetical protein